MKKLLSIMLLFVAVLLVSCGDSEVTDYYLLTYSPQHNYVSGGMDANLDLRKLNFREAGISEKDAIAGLEQEFAQDLASLTSIKNENTDPENYRQEDVDRIVGDIKSDVAMWKRWLICITHPSKENPDEAIGKIKESYKEVVQKGEYMDGNFKVKIIPIKGN
ncbi:MAG: hypothetical protein IJV11_02660 [Muribaculaceae bacterium]|nr:hypothetical protein [Muribaculaceae bacterium]